MSGFDRMRGGHEGISKISIQTGTKPRGVVLPDGTLAQVAIDFETLRLLSEEARRKYGMGGAVQHGASTLPENAFHKFVQAGACEVHLATAFQTLVLDHKAVPEGLRREIIEWVKIHAADERKPKDTEAQFIYKARKKAVGPFKKHFWSLPVDTLDAIGADLEKTFSFLFGQLAIAGTAEIVARTVKAPEIHRPAHPRRRGGDQTRAVDGLADDPGGRMKKAALTLLILFSSSVGALLIRTARFRPAQARSARPPAEEISGAVLDACRSSPIPHGVVRAQPGG